MYNRWIDGNLIEYLFRMVAIKRLSFSLHSHLKMFFAIKNKEKKNRSELATHSSFPWYFEWGGKMYTNRLTRYSSHDFLLANVDR